MAQRIRPLWTREELIEGYSQKWLEETESRGPYRIGDMVMHQGVMRQVIGMNTSGWLFLHNLTSGSVPVSEVEPVADE
jgi:hypothetical protein